MCAEFLMKNNFDYMMKKKNTKNILWIIQFYSENIILKYFVGKFNPVFA